MLQQSEEMILQWQVHNESSADWLSLVLYAVLSAEIGRVDAWASATMAGRRIAR